jgi:hypothetical protein
MKPLDPVTMVAAIVIAAFAIDRTVTACLFLVSFRWKWADPSSMDGPVRTQAEKFYKLVYFVMACILGLVVYVYGNLSIFSALGFPPHPLADAFLTTLVLVAGSDRVAALLKVPAASGSAAKTADDAIQISGTVTLVSPAEAKLAGERKSAGGA